jgi:hypothetical protein
MRSFIGSLALVLVGCGGSAVEQGALADNRSLALVGEDAEVRGALHMQTNSVASDELAVALRWVIEESLYPTLHTTGRTRLEGHDAGDFALLASERPPPAALVANEATGRDGVGVAYVVAYVDRASAAIDCDDPDGCGEVQVGASPNTLIVYANEPWPSDGAPLFGFDGAPGVRPPQGWSLVHLTRTGCESRPTARAWTDDDTIDLVIIGDFSAKQRCEAREVQPDVD